MTVAAIRTALAAAVDTIAGLQVSDTYPGVVTPPHAFLIREEPEGERSISGRRHPLVFRVRVLAGSLDNASLSGTTLDAFVDPTAATGIRAAIVADPTLGGACENASVTEMSGDLVSEHGGQQYLAAEVTVAISAIFT